jgi:hypothetical protein
LSFYYWIVAVFSVLQTQILIRHYLKTSSPIPWLSLHFLNSVLWRTKVASFDEGQIICLLLSLPNLRPWRFIPVLSLRTL